MIKNSKKMKKTKEMLAGLWLLALVMVFVPVNGFAAVMPMFGQSTGQPIEITNWGGSFVTDVFVHSQGLIITLDSYQQVDLNELVISLNFFEIDPANPQIIWEEVQTISFFAAETNWSAESYQGQLVLNLNTAELFNIDVGNLLSASIGVFASAIFNEHFLFATQNTPLHERDFETIEETLLFLEFGEAYEFFLPYITPINQTLSNNGVTIHIAFGISVASPSEGLPESVIFFYVDGLGENFGADTWGNTLTVNIDADILSERGVEGWLNNAFMRHFDPETGRGYFTLNANMILPFPVDMNLTTNEQQINWELNFAELVVGVGMEQTSLDLDLAAILADHNPTFIPNPPTTEAFWGGGGIWGLHDYELGDMAFLTDPTFFQEQGILARNQLNIELAPGLILGNISLENDVLRIQYIRGFVDPMGGPVTAPPPAAASLSANVERGVAWPTFLYSVHIMGEQVGFLEEFIYFIGEVADPAGLQLFSTAISVEDLFLNVFEETEGYRTSFNQTATFATNIAILPSIFVEQAPMQVLGMDTIVHNLNLTSHSIAFQIFDTEVTDALSAVEPDVFDIFEMYLVFADGTILPLGWNSASLFWPSPDINYARYVFEGFGVDIEDVVAIILNETEILVP
ncbi:MAG: hypothetical protein FWG63_01000 [Defluviitaleaceae bacterium]|nr:hypothetical protein [Defluviitaleaceae bacterium]